MMKSYDVPKSTGTNYTLFRWSTRAKTHDSHVNERIRMSTYAEMAPEELLSLKSALEEEYAGYREAGLKLNMARGKPSSAQLDLSLPMLDVIGSDSDLKAEDGTDCRNYGVGDGLPEAKRLMATMLDDEPDNIIVGGNSSLNLMYDALARCFAFGTCGSRPWSTYKEITWICPVPGYDRHFGVTEAFGVAMVAVPMHGDGPDMDAVEELAARDESVKGIWCVPKYSNPTGATYSDEVVRRLASMACAADDFRIFWDNAYTVHHLYDDPDQQDEVLDIAKACREAGNPDRPFKFASTSKVTFPGAGISAIAASPANIADIKARLGAQTIGHDKINQLRHVRFLKDADGIAALMSKHAALLRPKFELVERMLADELEGTGCTWSTPRGGYFICFTGPANTAKRIIALAKDAGVTMTGAGAPFPYHNDPDDATIRIAPSLPPLDELEAAMNVFTCCAKLACIEAVQA